MLELSTLVNLIKKHRADIQSVSANARHALTHRGTNTLFVGLPSVDMRSILKNQIDALINEGHTWDEILYIDFEDAAFEDFETTDLQRRVFMSGLKVKGATEDWVTTANLLMRA